MLQNIHDKAKGWIAYAIVIFISIPFALFGINSYLGGSDSLVAADVNGEEIPAQLVQNSVLQQRQRLTQMFGGKLPAGFSDSTLKTQALEQSVNQVLLRQLAKEYGYRASNQEVYDYISQIPAFQKNGQFDVQSYEMLLGAQRRTKAGFEAEVRETISNQQFSDAINAGAFTTKEQAKRIKGLQDQKRNIDTYTLAMEVNKGGINVSDDEIKQYYDARPDDFMTPEETKISYIKLNANDLQKDIEIDEQKLKAFYELNRNRYITPEKRKVSHVLIKVDPARDGVSAEQKAKEKIDLLYEQIKSGSKSFEEIAGTESEDELAKKNSGEIGLVLMGDLSPGFDKVAFSLKKDEISEPVKTEAGFEIIKVNEIVEKQQKDFQQVKAEAEKAYRKEEAEKLFIENSDKLQTLAFENDTNLEAAADALGVKIQSSGWIFRENKSEPPAPGVEMPLEKSPKIIAAAFSDDVLNLGKNSELIEIESGVVAVVRTLEHKVASRKPLSEVSAEIKDRLIEQKARKITLEKGESLLAGLQKNGWSSLESAGISKDKFQNTADLTRSDNRLSREIVDSAFKMRRSEGNQVTFSNTVLPNGDYILLALNSVLEAGVEPTQADINSYDSNLGAREKTAVLKAVRERAEVTLFPENIQ